MKQENKKRASVIVLTAVLISAVLIGATLAYFTDSQQKSNVITMGHVDISLEEPGFPESGEIADIKPGSTIIKDPTVTVNTNSEAAYVRVKLDVERLSQEKAQELLETGEDGEYLYLDIDRNKWIYSGGYYYYVDVVNPGESAIFFSQVTIPKTWGNEMAEKSFDIKVMAEAIQAANFKPSAVNGVFGWFAEDGGEITPEFYK